MPRSSPSLGRRAGVLGAVALAAGPGLAACGSPPKTPMPLAGILTTDASNHSVTVHAVAAYRGLNGEMNFDGYSYGTLRIEVPYGWQVAVDCSDASGRLQHSCAVIADTPADLGPRTLPFPGASSPDPYAGTRPGQAVSFSFVADRTGTYRLACLVHGHEIDGMWDYFVVTPGGRPAARVGRGTPGGG